MTSQNYKIIPFTIIASNNNSLLILHPFSTLLNISNQFFQELNFCRLVWEIVRSFFEFILNQVTNRKFPSSIIFIWGYIKIIIVHVHNP